MKARRIIQTAPHFLTRGPERQQRRHKGINTVWTPGLEKPCRTEALLLTPRKAGNQRLWVPWGLGWMALLPTHLHSQGTPFPTPRR